MKIVYVFLLGFMFSASAMTQHLVKGTIKDAEGQPVPGVNVYEKGTYKGTVADLNGQFSFEASSGSAILVFSVVGYGRREVAIKDQSEMNITLEERSIEFGGTQVVGTRSNRSVIETAVPVDIIDVAAVTNKSGQVDVNQILQFVAPSFNSNKQSGADGADHIDPATLRGLGPDQTLVLINGKRRHQSSLVNIFGTRGRGNTGTDLNTIPAAAIDRIEILRDGASAQYGSDAIAGVINIVLKSSVNEFTGTITGGEYMAKTGLKYVDDSQRFDGETQNVNANYGIKWGEDGFANFTADFLNKAKTNRVAKPGSFLNGIYRDKFGDAGGNDLSFFFNSSKPIGEKSGFYFFGGISHRYTDAFAWTRTFDDSRNVVSIYPNGFNPRITSIIDDRSVSAGIRSKIGSWDMDINNTFGMNRFHYTIKHTLNASYENFSPLEFDAGGFQLIQNSTSLDFRRQYSGIGKGMNLALGAEYRIDNYQIFAGEVGSYETKRAVFSINAPGDTTFRPGGSQGFPGFRPGDEIKKSRTNLGAYADVEIDMTEPWMVGGAVRYENYSDFGNTVNAKLVTRYKVDRNISVRGSASTGFRAPSLAQKYFNSTFTDFVAGVPIDKVIARNGSAVANALGIPKLKEETATDLSGGFTARYGNFSTTIDGYYVQVKNRIVLTGAFSDSATVVDYLAPLGVGAAQFFTNAIDTRTRGLDVVLNYAAAFGDHHVYTSLAANFNRMTLSAVHTNALLAGREADYFGSREKRFLIASAPKSKINWTTDYKYNQWSANLQLVRFGEVVLENWNLNGDKDIYDAKIVTNITFGYDLTKNIFVNAGAANVFNVYPDKHDPGLTESGGIWDAVQMGFSGRFIFSRIGFKF